MTLSKPAIGMLLASTLSSLMVVSYRDAKAPPRVTTISAVTVTGSPAATTAASTTAAPSPVSTDLR
jgi:hypothetical protein